MDSSGAVIAALIGERARTDVEPVIADGVVSAPNVAEILDVCVHVHAQRRARRARAPGLAGLAVTS
jgi:PIN domain nuclease of toxin-antitoxin system